MEPGHGNQCENVAVTSEESTVPPAARSYEAVLHAIEADLKSGKIKVGDHLPGERALAQDHGISRASVRDAIRILDVMGVVHTAVGSGPKAGAVVVANPTAGLASTLRLHMATSHFPVADIVQTRVMMESWAAVEAAGRSHDDAAVARLTGLLDAMADPAMGREAFHVADAEFHVLLSSLAGNAVVTAMMESLRAAIAAYVSESVAGEDMWDGIVPTLRSQHQDILAAVVRHDGGTAAQLLRRHIEWFHAQTNEAA
jgi:GntR family transcriptional regulator, transcriptional repressor for pyruvate dehydrogenase complex